MQIHGRPLSRDWCCIDSGTVLIVHMYSVQRSSRALVRWICRLSESSSLIALTARMESLHLAIEIVKPPFAGEPVTQERERRLKISRPAPRFERVFRILFVAGIALSGDAALSIRQ